MVIIPGLIVLLLFLVAVFLFLSRYFEAIGERVLEFIQELFNNKSDKK